MSKPISGSLISEGAQGRSSANERVIENSDGENRIGLLEIIKCVVAPLCLIVFSVLYSQIFSVEQGVFSTAAHLFLVFLVPLTNLFFLSPGIRNQPSLSMLTALGVSTGVAAAYSEIFLQLCFLLFELLNQITKNPTGGVVECACFIAALSFWIYLGTGYASEFWKKWYFTVPAIIGVLLLGVIIPSNFYTMDSFGVFLKGVIPSFFCAIALYISLIPLLCLEGTWKNFREQLSSWPDSTSAMRFAAICIVLGVGAPFILDSPEAISRLAARKIASSTSESARASVRLFELFGDKQNLIAASFPSYVPKLDASALATRDNGHLDEAQKTYYRLTGKRILDESRPALKLDAPLRERKNRWNDIDEVDASLAMQDINGTIPGLEMTESKMTIRYCHDVPIATTDWRMGFSSKSPGPSEARCVIQMPPNSVLNKAIIWMNGKPVPITISPREEAKEAYRKVVFQKRDPLLITTCGPDRLFVQCYPVTGSNYLPIELHIVSALSPGKDGIRNIHTANIRDKNFIETGTARVVVEGTKSDNRSAFSAAEKTKPIEHLYIVLDGGVQMQTSLAQIKNVLASQSKSGTTTIILASDQVSDLAPLHGLPSANDFASSVQSLHQGYFKGGPDNLPFLKRAWDKALLDPSAAVLWIHGPQPYLFGGQSPADVAALFNKSNPLAARFIDCEICPGSNKIIQSIDENCFQKNRLKIETLNSSPGSAGVPPASKYNDDIMENLKYLLTERQTQPRLTLDYSKLNVSGSDGIEELHLLKARDEVQRLIIEGKLGESTRIALENHIVSPTTAAVALETAPLPSFFPMFRFNAFNRAPVPYEGGLDSVVKVSATHTLDNVFRIVVSQLNHLNTISPSGGVSSLGGGAGVSDFAKYQAPTDNSIINSGKDNHSISSSTSGQDGIPNLSQVAQFIQGLLAVLAVAVLILCASLYLQRKELLERLCILTLAVVASFALIYSAECRDILLVLFG